MTDESGLGLLRPRSRAYDRPVIFVPGFMASRLERVGSSLLRPTLSVWPLGVLTLTSQLQILRNPALLKADGLVGHYYDSLLDFITRPLKAGGLGRTLERDSWVFAYDWRQSCHASGGLLAEFIGEKLAEANQRRKAAGLPTWKKVDLICHSMGGTIVRSAQIEFRAPVRRAAYIASGHYGFAKAYLALHPDTATKLLDDFVSDFIPTGYWDLLKTLPNVWFLQSWLAKLLRTFPAMFELLPDQFYLEAPPGLLSDGSYNPPRPISGVKETYFEHSWRLPPQLNHLVWEAMQFKTRLGRDLPGKYNLMVYATTLPTYTHATASRKLELLERLSAGDGTTTAASVDRAQPARHIQVEATHTLLPSQPATHAAIRAFLKKGL